MPEIKKGKIFLNLNNPNVECFNESSLLPQTDLNVALEHGRINIFLTTQINLPVIGINISSGLSGTSGIIRILIMRAMNIL
jgi:hypothetical protein